MGTLPDVARNESFDGGWKWCLPSQEDQPKVIMPNAISTLGKN
jgi:hypothetical protein